MNSAGDIGALVRRRPAQQRLGAGRCAPLRQIDQRLVVQRELAVLERAPQVGLGREARLTRSVICALKNW